MGPKDHMLCENPCLEILEAREPQVEVSKVREKTPKIPGKRHAKEVIHLTQQKHSICIFTNLEDMGWKTQGAPPNKNQGTKIMTQKT